MKFFWLCRFPYNKLRRQSCLVRNALYPDRQRIFICPCPSMICMMKSDVCTWSPVRKLYCACRCNIRTSVSWTSSESKSSYWNQIDFMPRFSSESKSETLSRSIQMSSEPKSEILRCIYFYRFVNSFVKKINIKLIIFIFLV